MVGPGVDHQRGVAERIRVLTRLTVRQSEEHDVVTCERLGCGVLQSEVSERPQVRLMLHERLTGVRVSRHGADLDVGMRREEAQDLAARVAGCAGDGDGVRHASTLTVGPLGERGVQCLSLIHI